MAESVVCFVLERLQNMLVEEANLLSGVRNQVEQLQRELERMRCFLKDADSRQDEDEMIRIWIAQVRELALNTEDVLEMYTLKIPQKQDNNSVLGQFFGIFREGLTLHQVGSQIQRIKREISDLATSMQNYGIRSLSQRENPRYLWINRSFPHYIEQDFVGLEGDVEGLAARLVNEDGSDCHRVVSIYGMGGVGKSTVAKRVYHHHDVRQHFQAFAWASISRRWQARDVLGGILSKLSPENKEEIANLAEDELFEKLYNFQKKRKCLVVLDDIWSMDFWDVVKPAFPNAESGSRIILTTRIKEVAMLVDPTCFLYQPRFLNAEESWELLRKKALLRQRDTEMEKIGRKMAAQCGGLPLAIVVLGGLLMMRTELNEWEEVSRNLNLYRRGARALDDYGVVYKVLALSYDDLPYHLKPCFLHLGNFPEDCKIPTRKLIQLWAAEGFVQLESHQGEEEETMMDIGARYLGELAQRGMVQLQIEDSTGRLKSCCLHDLMRDICLSKGREENFLRIVSEKDGYVPGVSSSSPGAAANGVIRRFSVAVSESLETYFPPKGEKIERVRSAIFFSRLACRKPLQSSLILLCNNFNLLRVLELENFYFDKKLPKSIGNLICLRYMNFRSSQFRKLSSSVGNLKYLQTLDLRVNFFSYLDMPDVIWKLKQLRHLYLPPSHGYANKLQLSSLSKLETLKNFNTEISDVKDLLKLTKLRKLTAIFSLNLYDLEGIIRHLIDNSNRLRDSSLRIYYNFRSEKELILLRQLLGSRHLRKLDLIGEISDLPHYRHFSSSLTTLTLRRSGLEEDPMPILENLPGLRTLSLRANAFAGKKMCCSPEGFPELRTLQLEGLLKLKKLKVEEGAMTNLFHLEIDGCMKLKMVPDGLRFINTIQELVIINMPDTFKRRLIFVNEREGADLDKVRHISSVIFRDTSIESKKLLETQRRGSGFSGILQTITPSSVPLEWRTL